MEKYVLIVEDDPFYSSVYKTKVEKEGVKAVLAENGTKALAEARKHRPAVIVLDLVMPEMDGFRVLTELKQDALLKDVPVLVLSNLSQEEDIKRVMDMGAEDYIVKAMIPINQLVARIKRYLV